MPAQEKQKEKVEVQPKVARPVPEKELFKWTAQARPFKRRDREFWITIVAIAAISGLILFLIEGAMPVILIISLIFLFYILTTVEPGNIEFRLTNKGVKVAEKRTSWEEIVRYWFSHRFDSELLIFETTTITGRLELVINKTDKDRIKKVLKNYIYEEEAPPSYLDRTTNWFSKKLPGNK